MVLSVIEEIDLMICIFESKRWLTCIVRWVDDIWIAVIVCLSRDLLEIAVQRCTLPATTQATQCIEMIQGAYKSDGLELNSEAPNIFEDISVLWCQSENCFKLRQNFPDAAILDRKYRND